MKKVSALLCLVLLFSVSLMAQDKQLDITINYSDSNDEVTAAITVTVTSEKPDFKFYLMTNDPVKGVILMESKPQRKNTYTFKNIKPGSYFVKIADGDGKLYGKTVRIKTDNLN